MDRTGLFLLIRLGLLFVALWAISFDQPWRSLVIIPCLSIFLFLAWRDYLHE